MKKNIVSSLKILAIFTLLTGIVYPVFITIIAQTAFPFQANGSLICINGRARGSELLGQEFRSDRYFWGRPSACNYATLPSGASNLGPTSDTLRKAIDIRRKNFIWQNHLPINTIVPNEMLTTSGSGLDPHISVQSALMQINRIALSRHFAPGQSNRLYKLVNNYTEKPQLGCLGEQRVNVLKLNHALDLLK